MIPPTLNDDSYNNLPYHIHMTLKGKILCKFQSTKVNTIKVGIIPKNAIITVTIVTLKNINLMYQTLHYNI